MLSTIILASMIMVTHAPGWSDPIITEDQWSYIDGQNKTINVFGDDTLHQFWDCFNQENRIGYKVYLPDGTVVFPEVMVSSDLSSAYVTSTLIQDNIAGFWRQGVSAWYGIRDSTGGEILPTTLLQSDPYYLRTYVNVAADSLGRIHAATVISSGVLYTVTEPGMGEIFRDTIPGSFPETAKIQVDGNRVHIFYRSNLSTPMYVQYDLTGNITIPAVILATGVTELYPLFSTGVDVNGDVYMFTPLTRSYSYLSLFKVDGETGEVLICDKEIETPGTSETYPVFLADPSEEKLYLMWIATDGNLHYWVYFAVIDTNGNYIEEPYPAYDYTDEDEQNLSTLSATINQLGDIFAIWSQGDFEVGGYWIVMGWFDHNWVEIGDEEPAASSDPSSISASCNPVSGSVSFTVTGASANSLEVYDVSGRLVATVPLSGGSGFWDGRNGSGERLPYGVYRVSCGDVSTTVTLLGE